jgi:hypothetical protein
MGKMEEKIYETRARLHMHTESAARKVRSTTNKIIPIHPNPYHFAVNIKDGIRRIFKKY